MSTYLFLGMWADIGAVIIRHQMGRGGWEMGETHGRAEWRMRIMQGPGGGWAPRRECFVPL